MYRLSGSCVSRRRTRSFLSVREFSFETTQSLHASSRVATNEPPAATVCSCLQRLTEDNAIVPFVRGSCSDGLDTGHYCPTARHGRPPRNPTFAVWRKPGILSAESSTFGLEGPSYGGVKQGTMGASTVVSCTSPRLPIFQCSSKRRGDMKKKKKNLVKMYEKQKIRVFIFKNDTLNDRGIVAAKRKLQNDPGPGTIISNKNRVLLQRHKDEIRPRRRRRRRRSKRRSRRRRLRNGRRSPRP